MVEQRFLDAIGLAVELHEPQIRKVRGDAYIGHIFAVTALVMTYGGNTDEIVGALLHDVVEDAGYSLDDIRAKFGDEVADIVDTVSERGKGEVSYKDRKRDYAARLEAGSESALFVSLCDKTHNLETTLNDLRDELPVWEHFDPATFEWYYGLLLDVYEKRATESDRIARLTTRVARVYDEIIGTF